MPSKKICVDSQSINTEDFLSVLLLLMTVLTLLLNMVREKRMFLNYRCSLPDPENIFICIKTATFWEEINFH